MNTFITHVAENSDGPTNECVLGVLKKSIQILSQRSSTSNLVHLAQEVSESITLLNIAAALEITALLHEKLACSDFSDSCSLED